MNTKRPLEELSKDEHDLLGALRDRISVGAAGTTALARRITGDPKLKPRDEVAQTVYHLVQEGWIVFDKVRNENFAIYKVSADFTVLQPA